MPDPISSNSSVYDPSTQMSRADDCDPSQASCAMPGALGSPSSPREITLAPINIDGNAGAQVLVQRFEQARRAPNCATELKTAALDCTGAAATALGAVACFTTVIGAVAGVGLTFVNAANCGKDLRALYDCNEP
jgi:hypothetical protein